MKEIFKKFPSLLITNIALLGVVSLLEAASVLTLVPVADLLIKPDLGQASVITRKAIMIMHNLNLPVTTVSFMVIFIIFNVLVSGFQILVKHITLKTKYRVLQDYMVGTFSDFLCAKWQFFTSHKQGVLLNTFINEIRIVGDAFGAMALFFVNLIQLLLYLAVPFYLSWQIASISLCTAMLFALPFVFLGKINYKLGKQNTSTANQLFSVIQESIGSAKVILGFGNQNKSVRLLDDAYKAHRRATITSQTLSMAIPILFYPLGLVVVIIALFSARQLSISLSETVALLYSLLRVIPFVGQLPTLKNSLDNFFPSYEQIVSLRLSAKNMRQKSGSKVFKGFNGKIALENLTFAYPGNKPVLENINVVIPKGKMVAFVGPSGSGKSTLVDSIMGFNEPLAGKITLDGVLLYDFDIISYRQRIGYVPQDSILFNMSISNNLLWANKFATADEIKDACRLANAVEFIEELPNKYDTLVGDRGVRLSGGQVQRLALARAMLRKPEILILDEATSSLDTHSERLIQKAIENISKKTTVIAIAHRLSTITSADYIYVLQKGCILEEGTYSDLMKRKGEFSRMLHLQTIVVNA